MHVETAAGGAGAGSKVSRGPIGRRIYFQSCGVRREGGKEESQESINITTIAHPEDNLNATAVDAPADPSLTQKLTPTPRAQTTPAPQPF